MLVWLDWKLAILTAAVMPISLGALVVYRRRLEKRVAVVRQKSADIGSFLIETLQAHTLVVASNAQVREAGRFRRLNDSFIDALMAMQRVSYLAGGLPGMVLSLGASAVFLYGGWRVVQGTLTLGTFAAFIAYQMRIMAPVQALMGLYTALATAKVSWHRVLQLLDAPVEVTEAPTARPLTHVEGSLRFEHVSLTTDRGVKVLDDVTFDCPAGHSVAIVGASGSGKSTIAALTLRLLDPDSGIVRLDGEDLREVRLADLRRHVVLVEQEPVLLHATIAENLRYGLLDDGRAPLSPAEQQAALRKAAAAAGVAAFIESLPDKYETVVGERGLQLSAGERQRLALARAFLANPSLLVLDEPTAALDPISERAVVDGYRAVMRGRTTLIISHRREVAMSADRVVVLQGAQAVQVGRPDELIVREGAFATLFGSPTVPSV
jgi:ATP-binding cassette subfamily B protein